MYTIVASFNVQLFFTHTLQLHMYMAWFPLPSSQFPLAPLAVPLLLPFVPLSTYLAPSSCDRNRPPSSQVACKLTLFAPPSTQLSHPFQLPRTPTTQRLQRRHWDHSALAMRNKYYITLLWQLSHVIGNRINQTLLPCKFP
jgi:hypothetical protein